MAINPEQREKFEALAAEELTVMVPGKHINNWGAVLNRNLAILDARSQTTALRPAEVAHPILGAIGAAGVALAVVSKPVSRKGLFSMFRSRA